MNPTVFRLTPAHADPASIWSTVDISTALAPTRLPRRIANPRPFAILGGHLPAPFVTPQVRAVRCPFGGTPRWPLQCSDEPPRAGPGRRGRRRRHRHLRRVPPGEG